MEDGLKIDDGRLGDDLIKAVETWDSRFEEEIVRSPDLAYFIDGLQSRILSLSRGRTGASNFIVTVNDDYNDLLQKIIQDLGGFSEQTEWFRLIEFDRDLDLVQIQRQMTFDEGNLIYLFSDVDRFLEANSKDIFDLGFKRNALKIYFTGLAKQDYLENFSFGQKTAISAGGDQIGWEFFDFTK